MVERSRKIWLLDCFLGGAEQVRKTIISIVKNDQGQHFVLMVAEVKGISSVTKYFIIKQYSKSMGTQDKLLAICLYSYENVVISIQKSKGNNDDRKHHRSLGQTADIWLLKRFTQVAEVTQLDLYYVQEE